MTTQLPWTWRPIEGFLHAPRAQVRLEAVLDSWEGTPYMPGQAMKGQGVDCVRFVCAVLDEMYRVQRIPVPRLPQDTAMHDRAGAVATMRFILGLYPSAVKVEGPDLESGDVLVVAPPGGGPGHAMIVGARRNELWHSTGSEVQMTGIGFLEDGYHQWTLCGIYRASDKERWI